MEIPGYLTSDQVAARLGITRQSVYNLVNRVADFPKPEKIGRASGSHSRVCSVSWTR